jgi:energy-coupling factor transporter ATP-binding protein EcfA2
MNQLLQATDSALADLQRRAAGKCIRFRQQAMPPGSTPLHADVGIEVDSATGVSQLHVRKGIFCPGATGEVVTWLQSGTRTFRSFDDLVRWIRGPLKAAYASPASSSATPDSGLTDMNSVREALFSEELRQSEPVNEKEIASRLGEFVLGQEAAVQALAGVVARHCARVAPKRPAVLFAVGPTGVGKTRVAEMLAKVLRERSGGAKRFGFLRLDMTEYQEAHRVSQLIGSPQGYVGHGEGAQLVDALRANPRTVVLFDEIEKAHPSILRLLMNTMDAGRLSTASGGAEGRDVDCREAFFVFTSNLDADGILSELANRKGFGDRSVEDEVCRRRVRKAGIAPEIVGRIGRFLVFRQLSAETRAAILALTISEVAVEYGVTVRYIEPAVIVNLMRQLESADFGARPAQYLVDELLGSLFARAARSGQTDIYLAGPPYRVLSPGENPPVEPASRESADRVYSQLGLN